MATDIYPEPRERSKSMGMMDNLQASNRGNATRSSTGDAMGSSLPLPSLLSYIRRNSSICDSLSSGIGSSDDLSSSEEDLLLKFNRKRSSSIKDILIQVPVLPKSTHLPKTANCLPTSPKSAPASALGGKPFSLLGLWKGQNTVITDNQALHKDLPQCQASKTALPTSQANNTTVICDSQQPAQNAPKPSHNAPKAAQIAPKTAQNAPKSDRKMFTKVSKRELNFTSPISF